MKKQDFHIIGKYRGCASNLYITSPKNYLKYLKEFIDFAVKESSNCSMCPVCKKVNYKTIHRKKGDLLYTDCSIHGSFVSYKSKIDSSFVTMTVRDSENNDYYGPFFYRETDWIDYVKDLTNVHKIAKDRYLKVRLINEHNRVEFALTPDTIANSVYYLNKIFTKGGTRPNGRE